MTWNPSTGCDQVSPGCDNCYALTMAKRLKGMGQAKYQLDGDPRTSGPGFGVSVHPDELDAPLQWRKPRRVFVDSMGDLFHDAVPDEFIARVWAVMAATPQHTYQVLTKRHGRMRSWLRQVKRTHSGWWTYHGYNPESIAEEAVGHDQWPLPNVWLGVSVEDQKHAGLRIPALLDAPAAVRFISAEPLLGPVDLRRWTLDWDEDQQDYLCQAHGLQDCPQLPECRGLQWCIVGGESGPGARLCDPEWIRSLVKQCQAAGIPAFVKQMGSVWARQNGADSKGGDPQYWPEDLRIRRFPTVGAA
jgi:protein gp37